MTVRMARDVYKRQVLTYESENESNLDRVYAKGMRANGTPLSAYSLALDYNVKGWFFNLTGNYYDRVYICLLYTSSNIMVNMFYALFFAGKGSKLRPWILGGFGVVITCNLVLLLFFYI